MTLQRLLLIAGLLAACPALPPAGKAQQQGVKLSRIGVLMNLYSPDAAPPQALRKELPTMFMSRHYVEAGGLASYGPNFMDGFRHAARYVDKILKGSRPGDLPVEQPMRFELTINANAAKALGLTLTPSVLTRVDELIQ